MRAKTTGLGMIQNHHANIVIPNDNSLSKLFETQVKKTPNHCALIFDGQSLSYKDLNERANQLAHYLREHVSTEVSFIAICMQPSFELLISIIAVLKAGFAYVPLDPKNPLVRQRFIISNANIKHILTMHNDAMPFVDIPIQTYCLDVLEGVLSKYPLNNLECSDHKNELAYVIYTSGSTGKPKGVLVSEANVIHFIHWYSQALLVKPEDRFDFSSSISFDFAVANTLFPLLTGATVIIAKSDVIGDLHAFLNHLERNKVTILKITPGHFRYLKEIACTEAKHLALRWIVFGGETLFAHDLLDWFQYYPSHSCLCEYGPTEATVACSWIKIDKTNINKFQQKIPIGKPALNTRLYLLDANKNPVKVGEVGELYIGGNGVAQGYLNQSEKTKERFLRDWFSNDPHARLYKTGDLCRYTPEGFFIFMERNDYQVKIRGFRIELEEIAHSLLLHEAIRNAVVVVKELSSQMIQEKHLIAYYTLKDGAFLDTGELRQFVKNNLPDYMVPTFFVRLPDLPLSANGKIDRQQLPELSLQNTHRDEKNNKLHIGSSMYGDLSAVSRHKGKIEHGNNNVIETMLQTIWQDTLSLSCIDRDDNFFELGGHSLAAARILAKVKQKLHKSISLKQFYQAQTIAKLASILQNEKVSPIQNSPQKQKYEKSHLLPLSELQLVFWLMHLFYPHVNILNVVRSKRIQGVLEIPLLEKALAAVCEKFPVLSFHISRYKPVQQYQQLPSPILLLHDCSTISPEEQERTLYRSFETLQHHVWKKCNYLFELHLFLLDSQTCELQLAMSHFVSDEVSVDIFFSSLSEYYLSYRHRHAVNINKDSDQYMDYILQDNHNMQHELGDKISFWERYLKNIPALYFPENHVTHHKRHYHTVYIPIDDVTLKNFQNVCQAKRFSLSEGLCAAIGLGLSPYVNASNKRMMLNFIKSTREDDALDQTLGLMLRTDVVKLNLHHNPSFTQLGKQIQMAMLYTADFQACPLIVKLAGKFKGEWQRNSFIEMVLKYLMRFSVAVWKGCQIDERVLQKFAEVLLSRKKNEFFIDMNITHRFMHGESKTIYFGLPAYTTHAYHYDKTVEKNILNIWFERNEVNQAYLTLSGNLTQTFLQSLGTDILQVITERGMLKP